MNVVFQERHNNTVVARIPPPVSLVVEKYSHMALGGPAWATIRAKGSVEDLLQFLDWLRIKVVISSEGRNVWWGYIHRVEVEFAKVRVSADLDRMANRVAVAYTLTAVGENSVGSRDTTDYSEHAQSIKIFGYKELLKSVSDTTLIGANAARDRALGELALGQAGFQPGGGVGEPYAVIECRGWWSTLDWRYCAVPTTLALAYETIGTLNRTVGDDTYEKLAQAFDVSTAVNLQQIEIYIGKVGSPSDNVKVAICANPDDATPGAELASQTYSGANLSEMPLWVTFTLSSPLALTAGTSYFLVVSRSGSQDASNHYVIPLDENQGYGAGPLVYHNGSAWVSYAADMPFRLFDNVLIETTQQIKGMIENFGQFLRRVRIEDASGFDTESYRDGDTTARFEIERLMEIGGPNGRRLLAQVAPDRSVRIYEQDASTSRPHFIDARGEIYDPYGNKLAKDTCPAGVWVSPKDIIKQVGLTTIGGLQAFFVEEMEYNALTDELNYQASNLPDPFDLGARDG